MSAIFKGFLSSKIDKHEIDILILFISEFQLRMHQYNFAQTGKVLSIFKQNISIIIVCLYSDINEKLPILFFFI